MLVFVIAIRRQLCAGEWDVCDGVAPYRGRGSVVQHRTGSGTTQPRGSLVAIAAAATLKCPLIPFIAAMQTVEYM